ncbi:hypothetical protein NKH77_28835 [Streptomyces sp. M19]
MTEATEATDNAGAAVDENALAAAWDAQARARTVLGSAAVEAARAERTSDDAAAVADAWAGVERAREEMENAEARLRALGVSWTPWSRPASPRRPPGPTRTPPPARTPRPRWCRATPTSARGSRRR